MSKRHVITFYRDRHIRQESDFDVSLSEAQSSWDEGVKRVMKESLALKMIPVPRAGKVWMVDEVAFRGTLSKIIMLIDAWFLEGHGGPSYEGLSEEDIEEMINFPDSYDTFFDIK